jgi:hypothetical protein
MHNMQKAHSKIREPLIIAKYCITNRQSAQSEVSRSLPHGRGENAGFALAFDLLARQHGRISQLPDPT